ncbi:restriction endonuclease subunit S [Streptomyces cacaoi]|uniref:restriction endonuclease subunit S n=1 Tax=Streptomyces cacaoi TaxID=1898 RepID=UPI00261EDF01|nr:restriction endonuclease subunit S [Streptomyces cacaoi]
MSEGADADAVEEPPKGWVRASLSDVASVRLGRQRSPKNHEGESMRPYMRAANVGWEGLQLDDVKHMNFSDEEAEKYRLHVGDIVLNEASGSPNEVGKPALWNGEIDNCCFQNTLIRVRCEAGEPRFFLHLLRFEAMRGSFGRSARGVGVRHLGAAALSQWPISLPPAPEQRRIADALEARLARVDKLVSALDRTRQRLAAIRRAILLDLVPDPEAWPADWEATTTAGAGEVELGRARHPDWHDGPEMRPYLRVANVFEDRIDTSDVMEMDFSGIFDRYRLEPGDILLNEGQSPHLVGRPAMYRGNPPNVAFTNSLLRFRASPNVLPEWALLVFRRHLHAGRFMREVRITTSIAHLSAKRLKSVEFPVPPLDQQKRLLALAERCFSTVDEAERRADRAATHIAALRRALLADAFAGRLVPQDPADEPSEKLLKRVRAQREAAEAERKAARRAARKATAGKRKPPQGDANSAAPPPPRTPTDAAVTGEQTALFLEFSS